jgi:hypothetical protein
MDYRRRQGLTALTLCSGAPSRRRQGEAKEVGARSRYPAGAKAVTQPSVAAPSNAQDNFIGTMNFPSKLFYA